MQNRYGDNTYNFMLFVTNEDGWARDGDDWLTDRREGPTSHPSFSFGLDNDMHGGAGNDRLHSWFGDDNLFGGKGDDLFFVDIAKQDYTVDVRGGQGVDTLLFGVASAEAATHMEVLDPSQHYEFEIDGTIVDVKGVEFIYY